MIVKAAPRFATILWLHSVSIVAPSFFDLRIPLVWELQPRLVIQSSQDII